MTPELAIGALRWRPSEEFLLVAGPCVIESAALCEHIAGRVKELCAPLGIRYVFKASFDKANRSSGTSYRGTGLDEGLAILKQLGKNLALPVTTDVHESHQCPAVGAAVDMLQIPAFLCRQTDLLLAAAKTGKAVNVKKGQFMAPWEMGNAVEKVRSAGNPNVLLTERGTFFGYNRLVNDMTAIPQMQALGSKELSPQSSALSTPVLMDATHSTQLPGGLGHATAGQREYVPLLARAAIAAGANGLFIEVHPEPGRSPSDAATILALDDLQPLLEDCLSIWSLLRKRRIH